MKNIIKIILVVVAATSLYSCQKDFWDVSDIEKNRMFMTMFRKTENTGNSSDTAACQVTNYNDVKLYWYGVEGASGYRIKMKLQSASWDSAALLDTTVTPDILKLKIEDLQYTTKFNFAIQTLSPKGEDYNSLWYGVGDAGHNNERMELTTLKRDSVPNVIGYLNREKTSIRITFNLAYNAAANHTFQYANGKFIMDKIRVEPSATNPGLPIQEIVLTDADKANGYVDVTGLTPNAVYIINGVNSNIKRYWDRFYNTKVVRMRGDAVAPILIPWKEDTTAYAKQYHASRLDTILNNYMKDNNLPEGVIFQLEAGKNYYLGSIVNIAKGLTLTTTDQNNRPTVYMGLGYNTTVTPNTPYTYNFSFGRSPEVGEAGGISIESIIFDGINFDAVMARNYEENKAATGATSGSGNYFINQPSSAMQFECESFEVHNCNFRKMVRGWVRIQGTANSKFLRKIVVDNCLFAECGFYDNSGNSYAYLDSNDGNAYTNLFNNVRITNSTFLDSPMVALCNGSSNLAWPNTTTWNIAIENCTFLNFNVRSASKYLFNMRYNPKGSTFTVKNNLFILTKQATDTRTLFMSGMDIRNTNGTGVQFDIQNNYSTNTNLTNSQIFTTGPFNSTTQGAGVAGGIYNLTGLSGTQVLLGATGISPTDLMVDPNPVTATAGPDIHKHNIDGLYYKNTDAVKNHEIYKNNIGDPRWRKNVTP